jgi:hypothetical protein
MKPEYGPYSVELDGRVALNGSSASSVDLFRQTLFVLQGLPNGPHAMRIINKGSGLDVDTVSLLRFPVG